MLKKLLLTGDYAKGIDSGSIEVVLVGRNLDFNYTSQLENKIEKLINRSVTFYLTSKSPSTNPSITVYSK